MTGMTNLAWQGPPLPPALAAALEQRGCRGRPAARGDREAPWVVCTSTARPPAAPDCPAGWIWVSRHAISDGDAANAVLRGAYAAVSLTYAHAVDALVK